MTKKTKTGIFGLTHLKYFSVSYLITIHSLTWIAYTAGLGFTYEKTFLLRLGFMGALCNLFIPATAGAFLRVRLDPYVKSDRLVNFPMKTAFHLCLFLMFIESFKDFFVYGFEYMFSWNALHFNGLAIFIVTAIALRSIRSLAFVAIGVILIEPFLRPWLTPFQVTSWAQAAALADSNYLSIMLRYYTLLAAAVVLFLILKNVIVPLAQRLIASGAVIAFAAGMYFYFSSYQTESPSFAARLYNLLTGALIGDEFGFHYWPIVPWLSVFIFGFLIYHYFLTKGDRFLKVLPWMCLPAFAYLIYFWNFKLDSFLEHLGQETLWSQYIFIGGWSMTLATMSMFVLNVMLCNLTEQRKYFTHYLIFEPVSEVFSATILPIYLFMTSLAIPLARLFNSVFPVTKNFIIFPVAMHLVCFVLGSLFIRITDSKSYRVTFIRND